MPGDTCVFCGNTRQKDPSVSMHRFPQDPKLRSEWIKALKLDDRAIKSHHRLCSRHFPQGNRNNIPSSSLGKRFASPKKCWTRVGLSELRIVKLRKTYLDSFQVIAREARSKRLLRRQTKERHHKAWQYKNTRRQRPF